MPARRRSGNVPARRERWHILLGIGAALAVISTLAFLWTASGLYNVAASQPHWAVTEAFIAFGLRRSVATQSMDVEVPEIDTADQIQLGAAHFETGCAPCHGSPDAEPRSVTAGMLPTPPNLDLVAEKWDASELAWIVQHGFKYTGMPAWPAPERQDEIWPLVSFLRALPMPGSEYRALAGEFNAPDARATPAFCQNCHQDADRGRSALVPPLAGQSEIYLARALGEYAAGWRRSGFMTPIAQELSGDEIAELAAHFAGSPAPSPASTEEISFQRGARLARDGARDGDVPACLACHGGTARPDYPVLFGLPASYIAAQLELWQRGGRDGTPYGALMGQIATRLSPQQISDVSQYFSASERPR